MFCSFWVSSRPRRKIMRAMLEDERCSLAAISSMTARSSRDSRSASLGPVAVLRGMRDLVS
nr:MAG TPA: hypothetical protein [Caudoviricetes sp.]